MSQRRDPDDATGAAVPRQDASAERMRRAEELFHAARALATADRTAYVARACGRDAQLRSLVERLLGRHTDAQVLDRPVLELGSVADAREQLLPERIGRYTIQRLLGEGGMGSVYEAMQDEPRRTVALKVLRPASSSPELLARFRREARVLGALQHPGIAQVHEAGTGELVVGGKAIAEMPFIAMELVRGETLVHACERAALSVEARLELFARVADAVAHAHAQGVVHRDLKPGNILVAELGTSTISPTRSNERPPAAALVPKVLDFGIARLVEESGEATVSTRTGQVLGTLAYMSPEQARGDGSMVDARADVWALGVILYELLAGRRPFELDGVPLAAAARRIQEEEPRALGRFDARLRGDLETIVAKALEKDPARRYANAAELAADLRRHLADEPIAARPPSATYLVAKFTRRNKALVIGSLAALVALVGGLGYGLVRARAERDEAQLATAFLAEVLRAPDPMQGGKGITMVQVVQRSVPELRARFAGKPLLHARLAVVLGGSLVQDDPEASRSLLTEAAGILARELGPDDPETLHVRSLLAMLDSLGRSLAAAEKALVEVGAAQERTLGKDADATLLTRERLADTYVEAGRLEEAVQLYREVLEGYSRNPPDVRTNETGAEVGLGRALLELGRFEEAEELMRSTIAELVALRGREHPITLAAVDVLAIVLSERDELDEAEQLTRENLAIVERLLGPEHAETLNTLNTLAGIEVEREHFDQARELLRDLLVRSERVNGPDDLGTITVLNSAAQVELRSGHAAEAEPLLRDLCERTARTMGRDHWYTWAFTTSHAAALIDLGRHEEAETKLLEAYSECCRLLGAEDERARKAAGQLARLYTALGRTDAVRDWRARAGS